jgi:V8-like Glu-specific endopeptidase
MEQRIDEQFLKEIKLKLAEGDTDEVMDDLKAFLEPMLSTKYFDEWVMHSGNYRRTEREFRKGLMTSEQYRVQMARANNSLLEFVNDLHRRGLKKQHPTSAMPTGIISKDHLVQEKVIGRSNLNSISWLRHGMEASKSVCKIILADKNCGTGFLLPDGSLMTNHHVLPDENTARFAKVAFDYEEDMQGQIRNQTFYQVDASTYRSDPTLDYALVRLNPASNNTPLSNWGALEPRIEPLPAVEDYVTIVQHPEGNPKQLSFDRISKVENDYLLYKADTLGGSSGSPVMDSNWKVLALHHGSLNKEDANRGTLMRAIKNHLGADCKW